MTFQEIEHIFNRASKYTFSRRKLLFMFPILVVCGLMLVFCRALAVNAGQWVVLSLTFLPVFLSSGLLLAAGVVLARVYHHEVKMIPLSFKKILSQSWELLIGVSYLTFPLLLAYLFLWMVMGIFYLLKEIPALGDVLGVILAFGPFLLVLGSLALSFFNLFLLFFATPHIALNSRLKLKLAEDVYSRFKENLFTSLSLFLIGLVPLLLIVGILSLAAFLTGISFFIEAKTLAIALQWFFVMIPFCAMLTPGILFFFNFAVESYALMQRKYRPVTE
ncbi:hypothetical protein [Candidatus Neptunochlamydia vexilliferae]|uniref:Glycerophosphoryl diester phosphodiesterase membrane domain-containing protein n=1 Tax=Candidatus Neptunichlamydia vexilliferae TaxID=1651774 RepID=A0ABS0AZ64_9BACT|nr:hypothetical protein [Candidatus Neptunochlamydia vexilliferae]MBF5059420.1 hypothetical protein [Candidatus Neptunochlamydia vexilliferae]